ncbi:MAG TPA: permease [Gammaproteobacteria bacterium]|nr:permease [Gammaproteobacteria bacterium]|tara:strand:- start:7 stop:759 length:753 start_codon:yes stop_codon:yes gene_type:complete
MIRSHTILRTSVLLAPEIFAAMLIIFVGSYVQSSIGFGLAIISAPVLFFIDPIYVPAPITISALTLSIANAVKHRHAVSFTDLRFAILGRVPGTVVGGLLLIWMDVQGLALFLGVSVIAAVLLSLSGLRLRATKASMFSAGLLSGFMGTSSGIGGPPMALVMQHEGSDFIRANLAAFFIVSSIMSLIMLTAVDRFGQKEMIISLPLMPAALAGYWVAMRTLHLVSHEGLRLFSLLLCILAGSAAILSYWM